MEKCSRPSTRFVRGLYKVGTNFYEVCTKIVRRLYEVLGICTKIVQSFRNVYEVGTEFYEFVRCLHEVCQIIAN